MDGELGRTGLGPLRAPVFLGTGKGCEGTALLVAMLSRSPGNTITPPPGFKLTYSLQWHSRGRASWTVVSRQGGMEVPADVGSTWS